MDTTCVPARGLNPLRNDENRVCAKSAQPPRVPVERWRPVTNRGPLQPASPARFDRSDQPRGLRTAILTPDRGLSKSRI